MPSTIFSMCFSIDLSTFNDGSRRVRGRRCLRERKRLPHVRARGAPGRPAAEPPQAARTSPAGVRASLGSRAFAKVAGPKPGVLGVVPDGVAVGDLGGQAVRPNQRQHRAAADGRDDDVGQQLAVPAGGRQAGVGSARPRI